MSYFVVMSRFSWHLPQVCGRLVGWAVERFAVDGRMSWSPWQSVHCGMSSQVPSRARPWAWYCSDASSWQVRHPWQPTIERLLELAVGHGVAIDVAVETLEAVVHRVRDVVGKRRPVSARLVTVGADRAVDRFVLLLLSHRRVRRPANSRGRRPMTEMRKTFRWLTSPWEYRPRHGPFLRLHCGSISRACQELKSFVFLNLYS